MKISLNLESYALMLYCSDFIPTKYEPLTFDEWYIVEKQMKSSLLKDVSRLFGLKIDGLTQIVGLDEYLANKILNRNTLMADLFYSLHNLENVGINVTTKYEENYPFELLKLKKRMPLILYYYGDISLLDNKCFSVVGPQNKTNKLKLSTRKAVSKAIAEDYTLISSGIKGIDNDATRLTLELQGKVVSFLSDHLFDRIEMYKRYVKKGQMCLVSAVDPYAYFDITNSLDRNIYVCALSYFQYVIATHINSGAVWFTSVQNLHFGWTKQLVLEVDHFYNGNLRLIEMGAIPFYNNDFDLDLSVSDIIDKNEVVYDDKQTLVDQMSIFEFIEE